MAQNIQHTSRFPADVYLLKVKNRNTGTRGEICSNKDIYRRHWCRSGVFIVNFEHISTFSVFRLLTLNMQLPTCLCIGKS